MAKQLFKLVMTATTTTNTVPSEYRYFHPMSVAYNSSALTLVANKFQTDTGTTASALVKKASNNGYYMLYVNGELQQSALYTADSARVVLSLASGLVIPASGVIVLTVTNFAPTSQTQVRG